MAARVLVVDDEPAVRTALERALALERYDVRLAADGRAALDHLVEHRVDAIVLDVAMPGVDGVEVCRRLRGAGDRTPVLMLTARDAIDDRVAGLDAGRGRLPRQAVRAARAAGAAAGAAAPRRARRPGHRALRGPRARPRRARGAPRRRAGSSSRAPSSRCWSSSSPTRGRSCRARRSSSGCGATTSARRPTRSASTSATCAARPRRAGSRACSTRCAGVGYVLREESS